MFRGPLVPLDRGDARRGSGEITQERPEQADTAVQVKVPPVRVDSVRKLFGDDSRKGGCREPVHLPEAVGIDAEAASSDVFDHDLVAAAGRASLPSRVCARVHENPDMPISGLDEVDAPGCRTPESCGCPLDCRGCQRQSLGRDDAVAPRRIGTYASIVVHVQRDPGPPPRAIGLFGNDVVADGCRAWPLELDGGLQAAGALQRRREDVALDLTLVGEIDVTELRAAGAIRGVAVDVCLGPDMALAVGRCISHLDGLGPPERRLRDIRQPSPHPFARNRVGSEHHPTVESAHEDPAVSGIRDLEVDDLSHVAGHASSISWPATVERCASCWHPPPPPGARCCARPVSSR